MKLCVIVIKQMDPKKIFSKNSIVHQEISFVLLIYDQINDMIMQEYRKVAQLELKEKSCQRNCGERVKGEF